MDHTEDLNLTTLDSSFVMIPDSNDLNEESFELMPLEGDSHDNHSEEGEAGEFFYGIRPPWTPDNAYNDCYRCKQPFSFVRRRHHCRFCGHLFCNDCCNLKVSYPPWFGYELPQRVCEGCVSSLFSMRRTSPAKSRKDNPNKLTITSEKNSKIGEDGTFHTSGTQLVSLPLRFLHPVCKFAFWFSGMYDGGNFDRTYLNTAASLNLPFVNEPVKSITRDTILVPKQWPKYDTENLTNSVWGFVSQIDSSKPDELFRMPVVIFTPLLGTAPYPILIWYHGGGFCLGSAENQVYHTICRSMANRAGCVVVSVEYRLAPEYKFPTQVEDAFAALEWCWSSSHRFNGDPSRIAVGGDSAGGSLAAVVSILARDRNPSIKICHQLLVYPCITDPRTDDIASHKNYIDGPVLSREICIWFMSQVFENLDEGLRHPFAMPLYLESHHKLPPATIINALHDPLCDHGALYAQRLREHGVPVVRSVYRKSLHGFFGSSLGESDEAVAEAAHALQAAFSSVVNTYDQKDEDDQQANDLPPEFLN